MTTTALYRDLATFAHSKHPSYATTVAASGAIFMLGALSCLVLPVSPFIALFASGVGSGAFELARVAVAKRRHVPEPFVHGPTILPPQRTA